jgi:membrane fusion protein, multidrug efflux system
MKCTPQARWCPRWLAAALGALAVITACGRRNEYQPPPPPTVTVSHPLRQPITDYLQTTGNIAASESVDLVARVEGYLRSVNFTDGSVVKKGQLLFVIEPDPYEAKLASAQAELANAQSEYQRQLRMIKENATSQANVEKWRSQRDQNAASVALAKINLGYTRITAPFDGRIGRHLIDPGNVVGAGTNTKLATIEKIDPVYLYFSVNERDVLRVRAAALKAGRPINNEAPRIPVELGLQTSQGYPYAGTLDFASTGFDTGSGTLQLRAVVPNAERIFLPGLFARIRIPFDKPQPTLTVPDRVVTTDQVGSYVLTVNAERRVVQQRIEAGPLQNGVRAVLSGLTPESEVIVDGLQNAVPGNLVTVREQAAAPAAAQAGGG